MIELLLYLRLLREFKYKPSTGEGGAQTLV